MNNNPKYCPECGSKAKEEHNFCNECGNKLAVSEELEDKEDHPAKAEEIIEGTEEVMESESALKAPKKLNLLPGERLLERHDDFYVSNKRLIKHIPSLLKTKTEDYQYHHINGLNEHSYKPFLKTGMIIGIPFFIIGLIVTSGTEKGLFILITGIIFIMTALWHKKVDMIIMHASGSKMILPNITSSSGKKVADIIRNGVYKKG